MNALDDASARVRHNIFYEREPLGFVEWAERYFYLSADATNTKGKRWKTYGYQRGVMHALADLGIAKVVIKKPTQVGMTQVLKAFTGYEVAHRYRSTGMWVPRDSDLNDFSNVQIKSMLRDCPEVSKELKVHYDKKDTDNTTHRRSFKSAQWYGRASQAAANFTAISVESALMDEANRMPFSIRMSKDDHGVSPFDVVEGRMDAARYRKLAITSTPTESGASNIEIQFESCREKFYQYHRCPNCGTWQQIEWGDRDSIHGFKWDRVEYENGSRDNYQTSLTAYYCCVSGCRIEYNELPEMDDQNSEYRSENLRLDNDSGKYYLLESDEEVEPPNSAAFQMRGYVSRSKSWQRGVHDFLDATDDAREGNKAKLIRWTQEYKAEDFESEEKIEIVRHDYLMSRAEDYDCECPAEVQAITGWWDLQKDRIEGWYVGWSGGEEMYGLHYYVRMGDPITTSVTDVISDFVSKSFIKPDGSRMPVSLTGVDCGYQPDIAYRIATKEYDRSKIIPTRGEGIAGRPIIELPKSPLQGKGYRSRIGTEAAKDVCFSRFLVETPGPGYIHFPEGKGHDDSFFKGLVSEEKKLKNGRRQWVKKEGVNNESLDAYVGNLALVKALQQRYGLVLMSKKEYLQSLKGSKKESAGANATTARERARALASSYRRR